MQDLKDVIRTRREDILQAWLVDARRAAAARGLPAPELMNLIGSYLSALGEAVEELGQFGGRRRELVESHFSSRLRHGFELGEMVEEFALLGRCIARMWQDSPPHERPDPVQVAHLFVELQLASAAVIDMFMRHMAEDEQTDKRYLRTLQAVAVQALQQGAPALADRLKDVLKLVMEAMHAQSAALLLCDPQRQHLQLVAAVGTGDVELERYAASLDSFSFAAHVATQEEPVSIADAGTAELEVSDALRRSGIHSLLGVRLPPRDELLGVMYVGLDEKRTFNAREVRRIELLGEQFTLHLDSARLYADLRDHIASLRSERVLRERFVSILAHDLRGPLSAAKLNAELLARQSERLDQHAALAVKIARNIERADGMIRDLLDVNQVRAGERLWLQIAECDLGTIAAEVIEELVVSHGDRFVLHREADVVGFWSAEKLRRALWNLATNAIKYGATHEKVTITARKNERGAEVSVHNVGPPISSEDTRHLFEPFARSEAAQIGGQPGWGLGLTLVHGCATAHGGQITVSSREDTGTTFTLELPLDARPFQNQTDDSRPATTPR